MRSLIFALIALLALPLGATAQPEAAPQGEAPLVVGVYAPRLRFANSLARNRLAEQLADALSAGLGRPVKGRGFVSATELKNQVNAGAVHFALVEAQTHVEQPQWPALAQSTRGGHPSRPMVLTGGASVSALAGASLAEITVGAKDDWFRTHYLMQSQITPGYFGAGKAARDAQGALSLVSLGKARGAFVYQGDQAGPIALTTRAVPLPVIVITARDALSGELKQQAARALQAGRYTGAPLDGFMPYNTALMGPLRGALTGALARRPQHTPLMATPERPAPEIPAYPGALGPLPLSPPSPGAGFSLPPPPGDLL